MAAGDRKKKLLSFEIDAQNDPVVCRAKWDVSIEAKTGSPISSGIEVQTLTLGEAVSAELLSIADIKAKLSGEILKVPLPPEAVDTEARKPPVAPPPVLPVP